MLVFTLTLAGLALLITAAIKSIPFLPSVLVLLAHSSSSIRPRFIPSVTKTPLEKMTWSDTPLNLPKRWVAIPYYSLKMRLPFRHPQFLAGTSLYSLKNNKFMPLGFYIENAKGQKLVEISHKKNRSSSFNWPTEEFFSLPLTEHLLLQKTIPQKWKAVSSWKGHKEKGPLEIIKSKKRLSWEDAFFEIALGAMHSRLRSRGIEQIGIPPFRNDMAILKFSTESLTTHEEILIIGGEQKAISLEMKTHTRFKGAQFVRQAIINGLRFSSTNDATADLLFQEHKQLKRKSKNRPGYVNSAEILLALAWAQVSFTAQQSGKFFEQWSHFREEHNYSNRLRKELYLYGLDEYGESFSRGKAVDFKDPMRMIKEGTRRELEKEVDEIRSQTSTPESLPENKRVVIPSVENGPEIRTGL